MNKEMAVAFPVKHSVKELVFKINPKSQTLILKVPAKISTGITKYSGNDYTVETMFQLKHPSDELEIKVVMETKVMGSGDFEAVKKLINENVTKLTVKEITKVIQRCSFALGYPAGLGSVDDT